VDSVHGVDLRTPLNGQRRHTNRVVVRPLVQGVLPSVDLDIGLEPASRLKTGSSRDSNQPPPPLGNNLSVRRGAATNSPFWLTQGLTPSTLKVRN
jgi:hypothetical protein